jgi:hypothetical protein
MMLKWMRVVMAWGLASQSVEAFKQLVCHENPTVFRAGGAWAGAASESTCRLCGKTLPPPQVGLEEKSGSDTDFLAAATLLSPAPRVDHLNAQPLKIAGIAGD